MSIVGQKALPAGRAAARRLAAVTDRDRPTPAALLAAYDAQLRGHVPNPLPVRLKVEKLAPLGDPMELIIKGYHLSLRREEGACILVSLEP